MSAPAASPVTPPTDATPVRLRRRVVGLTQADLAVAVGVSRQTIISMESGDYAPSVLLALRVARELQTTVEELWG
jgi:putative transcriptional regulator